MNAPRSTTDPTRKPSPSRWMGWTGPNVDVMWLAEPHFDPARSILSSPMCVASAVSARTRRMKIGTPDAVADRLRGLRDDLGLAGVLAELNRGGKVRHAHEMEALRLLCQEVRPRFH